jgi:hypothetical protein
MLAAMFAGIEKMAGRHRRLRNRNRMFLKSHRNPPAQTTHEEARWPN